MPRLVALVALVVACLAGPAGAFRSLPPGASVHDDITSVVASAGWPEEAVQALQAAVRAPDLDEMEYDPQLDEPGRLDAKDSYRHGHHCDRTSGQDDATAFQDTVVHVQQQRLEALNRSGAGDPDGAVAALGRALHALQDCYSHSNIVDLPDQQMDFEDALLHGGPAVPGLRLASFAPGADEPDDPPGDDYTHKDHNKDSPDGSPAAGEPAPGGNETRFESAAYLARLATVAFIQEFMHEVPEEQRSAILAVEDEGLPEDVRTPGFGLVLLLAGLLALAWTGRRR